MKRKFSKLQLVNIIAIVILFAAFFLAFFSSNGAFGDPGDSATMDEVAHIPAGYSMVKYLDYRLNPEHPPLLKLFSGISMSLQNFRGPINDKSYSEIDQWGAGWYMLYGAGNNYSKLLTWARFPTILIMLALCWLLFIIAKKWFGCKVGLIVLALAAFYPDILAHGRLVTTDVAAAFGYILAVYFFDLALKNQNYKCIIFAGLTLGVANLFKFSGFLLPFIFLILILVKAIVEGNKKYDYFTLFKKYFKLYLWVCLIALVLIWIVYIPTVWNITPEVEHQLIDKNIVGNAKLYMVRDFLHFFEGNPFSRAIGHYLLGVSLVFGRVTGGNDTFIMGYLSDKSIRWFFPVAWLVKTPIPVILMFFAAIVFVIRGFFKKIFQKDDLWKLSLILVPILFYWGVTLKGSLNLGTRHLLPTVPFVILLIGFLLNKLYQSKFKVHSLVISLVLILYSVVSVVSYYPSFLGYFNEFVPRDKRYDYLIDSSLDWGQDLLRLKKYIEDNDIDQMKLDYFGGGKPEVQIPKKIISWHATSEPTTGWLAVSATIYQSSKLNGPKHNEPSYKWLDSIKPKEIIGGSILVFNISREDLVNIEKIRNAK